MTIILVLKATSVIYDFGSLSSWISAFGTVAAVITSLSLANRRTRPKILLKIEGGNQDPIKPYFRIVNKSPFPVEFMLKFPNKNNYYKFPLEPMRSTIQNMKDSEPFNTDHSYFMLPSDKKDVVFANGCDIISGAKYYFLFCRKDDLWYVKQYRFYVCWKASSICKKLIYS